MSVIVKGMKMPEICLDCYLCEYNDMANIFFCKITNSVCERVGRRSDCPIVELPKNHGNLIDADELEKKCRLEIAMLKLKMMKEEPTIFEAEGERNENT